MKSVAFYFSPKIHHTFGLMLIESLSPRTFSKVAQTGFTTYNYPGSWSSLVEGDEQKDRPNSQTN